MGLSVLVLLANLAATIPNVIYGIRDGLYLQAVGVILASSLLFTYIAYLFYSGWTEFKNIEIKKPILLWLGVIATLVLSLFLHKLKSKSFLQVFAMISLVVSAQEVQRLIKRPTT